MFEYAQSLNNIVKQIVVVYTMEKLQQLADDQEIDLLLTRRIMKFLFIPYLVYLLTLLNAFKFCTPYVEIENVLTKQGLNELNDNKTKLIWPGQTLNYMFQRKIELNQNLVFDTKFTFEKIPFQAFFDTLNYEKQALKAITIERNSIEDFFRIESNINCLNVLNSMDFWTTSAIIVFSYVARIKSLIMKMDPDRVVEIVNPLQISKLAGKYNPYLQEYFLSTI